MKVKILIVSFSRDVEFCWYCLRSIRKFATGFEGVTLVVPKCDYDLFRFAWMDGASVHGYDESPSNGMMHHEVQIIMADLWCRGADAILHVDSDCMFWEPVTPADYFHEGKPILYRERYDTLTNKLRLNWRIAVENATGISPEWETMVRHPAIHIRETYRRARESIYDKHGDVPKYILSCDGKFPQGFAEFPTLGAVAIEHFSDKYHFVDYDVRTPDGGYPYEHGRDFMKAFWSHAGVDKYRAEMDAILA